MATGAELGWMAPEWLTMVVVALSLSVILTAPLDAKCPEISERLSLRLCRLEGKRRLLAEAQIDPDDADVLVLGMGRVGTGIYDAMALQRGLSQWVWMPMPTWCAGIKRRGAVSSRGARLARRSWGINEALPLIPRSVPMGGFQRRPQDRHAVGVVTPDDPFFQLHHLGRDFGSRLGAGKKKAAIGRRRTHS